MFPLHVGLDIINLASAITTLNDGSSLQHFAICHFQFLKVNSCSFILIQ